MNKLALLLILTASCTHVGTKEFIGPDGAVMHEAFCDGHHITFGDCLKVAGNACQGGYQIIERSEKSKAVTSGSVYCVGGNCSGTYYSESKNRRSILFKCDKEPKADHVCDEDGCTYYK